MDVVLMILYAVILLGVLVVIHEGGHFLAARAFGVRVTEFMVGLPGPSIGFWHKGTRIGITAVPLGGYTRVCGMEAGEESPHLARVAAYVYAHGEALMEDVAHALGITDDEAYVALDELSEWGTLAPPRHRDKFNTYRTPSSEMRQDGGSYKEGDPRPLDDPQAFIDSERAQTYRALPFWKRCVILCAGPGVNLLFAIVVFLVVFCVIGVDVTNQAGQVQHVQVSPLRALYAGFYYIGMVLVAVVQLFNPQTAADTISNSSSVVGVAVMSKSAADAGLVSFSLFASMISVSLGIMNMLPIPPLDGGRFVVEIYQRIRRRMVSPRALNTISLAGMAFFMLLFVVMLNQDIQRFVFGNW